MVGGRKPDHEGLYEEVVTRAAALPNLRYLGHVPFADIDAYFRSAALLVCTSQVEGMPNVFLQAWSQGIPVVTTYDPDGLVARNGLGLCAADAEGLVEAIGGLMADPARRVEMGARGREYLAAVHSPGVVVPLLERVLLDRR
jgi:glycosyltransferase involved in cell wall biosynthesis